MASDLDEAEVAISSHNGLDNNDMGALLGRLVRIARVVTRRMATIEARLDALEAILAPAPAPIEPVVEPVVEDAPAPPDAAVTDEPPADPAP